MQQLYIYPQSQPQVVVRVGLPQVRYEKLALKNPQIVRTTVGENYLIRLRDRAQQLEIQLTLDPQHLAQLKKLLSALTYI